MHHFAYKNSVLHAENVSVTHIANAVGTPFYCYSTATLRRHYTVFAKAFDGTDTLVAFSVKSLSNLAILHLLAQEGAGADVVSGGELARALAAGIPGQRIVFSGVGKTPDDMRAALEANIHQFNVESLPELDALNAVALSMGKRAPIALRVNPDISAGGHDKISTGRAEDKFGINWGQAEQAYAYAQTLPGIDAVAVDVHIGSQITSLAPFEQAVEKVVCLVTRLRANGCTINRIDFGGGLGIPYQHDPFAHASHPPAQPPGPDAYGAMIRRIVTPLNVQLIFEPGRLIAGNAGILVASVLYHKKGDSREFLIVDAAMNDLIRPSLYDAWHDIIPIQESAPLAALKNIDVVGPVCETGDTFALQRALPPIAQEELVAFLSAGAYGAVQASEYNTRPMVPEILVDDCRFAIIRERPSIADILARDKIPPWL